jgi:hypothetical protein
MGNIQCLHAFILLPVSEICPGAEILE